MTKLIFFLMASLVLSIAVNAQTTAAAASSNSTRTESARKPAFRAGKDQISQAQKILGAPATGKMDDAFRAQVKTYQTSNGLRATGSLNRATLEKLGVPLTDKQKEIPVDPKSFKSGDSTAKRGPVFRATKDQITLAQTLLKQKKLYSGDATGSLDDATRAALKAYQQANGLKATGTLNHTTLQQMGIQLTDKQKENVAKMNDRGA